MAIGNFSHLVTNAQMKKILADVAHINSKKLGKNYAITRQSHGACTSGPATWYRRAGIHLSFWNGAQPYTSTHKNYKKGKRSATVADMKAPLIKAGFQIVWSGTGQQANSQLQSSGILRPGDVATMLSSNSAHAAMWTGEDWRSDFLQDNKPYPYSSVGRGGNETFILWRYQPFQDSGTPQRQEAQQKSQTNNIPKDINWRSEKPNKVNRWGNPGKEYANTNAMALMNFLINKGLSLEAAAGVAGNLMSESGLNPYNYNANDNGGPSGGIAMWHNNRLNKLKQFANKRGKAWTDIATQAEYLWHELTEGGYKHVLNKLKNVKTIEDASFIWGDEFEVFDGHQNRNGKNHITRRNNAINFANEYKKYNHTLPQYAQMSTTPVNQNNQQNIDNNTQTDNWDTQPMYSTPVVNNFDRTFFPIIDTYLENSSKYKIKDSKKKVYSTVDYYDIISNSMQNNTKFQEGGSITSTIGTKLDKVQIPEFNTLDYAEIIRKVWNNSNGFVKLEDNPVVFGDGLDFSKFNINTEDNHNQNISTDFDQSNVSTGSDQNNETSTQSNSNQANDERNLISNLNFKENEYTIKDINKIVGSSLPENLESDFDFNNRTDWNKFNMKTLDELLKYIRNYPNAKEHPQEAVQGFSKDLLTLLLAYDMYKKGVTTTDEDYSIFDTPKQQSGGVITKNKKFSMGHPEDIDYEDDIYYNPPKESTTKKGDWNNEYEEIYYNLPKKSTNKKDNQGAVYAEPKFNNTNSKISTLQYNYPKLLDIPIPRYKNTQLNMNFNLPTYDQLLPSIIKFRLKLPYFYNKNLIHKLGQIKTIS